jgi:diguanylate cyclase (GGDEF)-like protein
MDYRELRTLIAEDDEDDYVITRDLLGEIPRMRFVLDWARSYEEALEAIENNRYDLCLLDYRLGPADGLQLLDAALAHGCTAPTIFLTGLDDWEIDFKVMKAGAADYLVKGQFDGKQLERSIRYAIERRQAQKEQLESTVEQLQSASRLAEADALTGLANRRKMERTIQDAIEASRPFSMLVFDLDGFKDVNDRHGHSQGDQLLKLVAQRMHDAVREADLVCRWGGDEFVIIMPDTSLALAQRRAEQIGEQAFGEFNLSVAGGHICVSATAGVGAAEYSAGETAAEFFERADQILLENKRRGRQTQSPLAFNHRTGSSRINEGRKAHRLRIR